MAEKNVAAKTQASAPNPDAIDTSAWNEANINIDAWYTPEVTGKLIGRCLEAVRINTTFGEQDVVKVRVGQDKVTGVRGKGDQAEKVVLERGQIIAVRISVNLTALLEMVANQCAVEILPQGEQALKGGKKMWLYGLRWQGTRAPLVAKASVHEAGGNNTDDEDLPF